MKVPPLFLISILTISLLVPQVMGQEEVREVFSTELPKKEEQNEEQNVGLITVEKYTAFLTAIASEEDPHDLYEPTMQESIISLQEEDHFSYQSVHKKEESPMIGLTLLQAMRYCNWIENRKLPGNRISTESGSYLLRDNLLLSSNLESDYHLVDIEETTPYFIVEKNFHLIDKSPLMMNSPSWEENNAIYPLKRVTARRDLQDQREQNGSDSLMKEDFPLLGGRSFNKEKAEKDFLTVEANTNPTLYQNRFSSLSGESSTHDVAKRKHQKEGSLTQLTFLEWVRKGITKAIYSSGSTMYSTLKRVGARSAPIHIEEPPLPSIAETARYNAILKYKRPAIEAAKKRIGTLNQIASDEASLDLSSRKADTKKNNLIKQLSEDIANVEEASEYHLEQALQRLNKRVISSQGYHDNFKKIPPLNKGLILEEGGAFLDKE